MTTGDETAAAPAAPSAERELRAVAELAQAAVGSASLDALLDRTVRLVGDALDVPFAKVLELLPGGDAFLLRSGFGWETESSGQVILTNDQNTHAGYTLAAGRPIAIDDLATERRFAGSRLLHAESIRSGASVIIGSPREPWGILSVHALSPRAFGSAEIDFLTAVANLLQAGIDKRQNSALLRWNDQRLRLGLYAADIGIFSWKPHTDEVWWDENCFRLLGLQSANATPGFTLFEQCVHPDDRDPLRLHLDNVLDGRTNMYDTEFRIVWPDGTVRWLVGRGYLHGDGSENTVLYGVNYDITRQKSLEQQQKHLESELNHRVRNILAKTSAVANQTRKSERTIEEYIDVLQGRIHAMAGFHTLLSQSRWTGVTLWKLVKEELQQYPEEEEVRINLEGEDAILLPRNAEALAMAIHELASNAARYGALSQPGGQVDIRTRVVSTSNARGLSLEWIESGGPEVKPAREVGFGTMVLQEMLPRELETVVDLDYTPSGLRCTILLPPQAFTEAWQADALRMLPGGLC